MLPLMANKNINYDQFNSIMKAIRGMLTRVEQARLEQLLCSILGILSIYGNK